MSQIDELFTDVYDSVPAHLEQQRAELRAHLEQFGEHYGLDTFQSPEQYKPVDQ